MKKILFLLILIMAIPVYAKENKLYFIEDNHSIKYESGLYDEKVFMRHNDMVPGSKYEDTLIIENGTKDPYKLYLKATPKSNSADSNNLLNSIIMKITIDGTVIYEGNANGEGNVNLADSIYLGEFTPNKRVEMKVDTYLSVEYTNPTNEDSSIVEWTFYAQTNEEPPHEITPITGSNVSTIIYIIAALLLVISIALFVSMKYKKN